MEYKVLRRRTCATCASLAFLLLPVAAAAHEVYVLTPEEITAAMAGERSSHVATIAEHLGQFMFWGLVTSIVVTTVFFMSISHWLENLSAPFFRRIKSYAPYVLQVGLGVSLLCTAWYGAFMGPELPFNAIFGSVAWLARVILVLCGASILLGYNARSAAIAALLLFLPVAAKHGTYLLTYTEYIGALLFVAIGGGGYATRMPVRRTQTGEARLAARLESWMRVLLQYRYAILRMSFGFAVMFAAVYAKIVHNSLALAVVDTYDLTSYALFSAFEPNFLVLGAALIEFLAGLLLFLGIEIRHTVVFLAFWLTLSLLFFGEAVWPHIILFAIAGTLFLYGYDAYSLEGRFFKKGGREPVL
ncbi:MAG: hypothetical protein G01um10148_449 [Parcubacteria group bacterium Gr01-1014_8]|nr:MAG: hypothetical protein G01um10148_449 [Parcubacteria group bacterium Gr01-1014_8]